MKVEEGEATMCFSFRIDRNELDLGFYVFICVKPNKPISYLIDVKLVLLVNCY